jgi:hypothetical protein
MSTEPDGNYSISAASRLSGVSREKIRIWERRYGAVAPGRDSANHRLYSRDDVERLRLIHSLAERGHAVSTVATLDLATLRARASEVRAAAGRPAPPERVLAVTTDAALPAHLIALGVADVATRPGPAAAAEWLDGAQADLLLIDQPTLLGQDVAAIVRLHRQAPRGRMLVSYRFAARAVIEQLERLGIRVSKAPLETQDLLHQAASPAAPGTADARPAGTAPARRYAPDALHRLAAMADTVRCECPRHLADLVTDLQAFEDYSLGCEAASPADAALHREIHRVVAHARALVEDALGIVAAEEGISL